MIWLSEKRYKQEGKGTLTVREKDLQFSAYWAFGFLGVAAMAAGFTGQVLGSDDFVLQIVVGGIMLSLTTAATLGGTAFLIEVRRMLLKLPPYRW